MLTDFCQETTGLSRKQNNSNGKAIYTEIALQKAQELPLPTF